VTFWRWYGIPILFSMGVASFVGWCIIFDQFYYASASLVQDKGLASFLRVTPFIIIGLLTLGATGKFFAWCQNSNNNPHIHAYTEIADYLKRLEPNGAVVQMFEPGSFGYRLGNKFKVVDELGLISPGVAKALLRGDSNYAMYTYKPKYLVCSWRGSYSECEKQSLNEKFELVGEYNVDFWKPLIGTGAKLYRRINNIGVPGKDKVLIKSIILGDRWGKLVRIDASSEWFAHPGETTDTVFEVICQNNCSVDFWMRIADLPNEAPPEAGNVKVKIVGSNNEILYENVITRKLPVGRTFLSANTNVLKVYVNNNEKPEYDWLVFGTEMHIQK
jgi:hypothetical protein